MSFIDPAIPTEDNFDRLFDRSVGFFFISGDSRGLQGPAQGNSPGYVVKSYIISLNTIWPKVCVHLVVACGFFPLSSGFCAGHASFNPFCSILNTMSPRGSFCVLGHAHDDQVSTYF